VLFVPNAILIFAFLNSFVMNVVSFPVYVEVAYFVFCVLMSCVFCMLSFFSLLCNRIIVSSYLFSQSLSPYKALL
jgi:hypothetical protein